MMINMIVTIFGLLLVIVGFYLMYLGFLTPPSPLAFFLGLIMTVLGMIIIILFGSSMELSKGSSAPKQKTSPKTARTEALKGLTVSKTNEKEKTPAKPIKRKVPPIRPRPAPNNETDASITPPIAEPEKEEVKPQEKEEVKPKETTKPPEPVKKAPKVEKIETPPKVEEAEDKSKRKPVKPQIKGVTDTEVKDDAYVKNRLERLKDDYILNAKDIETLVDERLDSFKGTLNRLKTETTDPSIIWSFEAQDVQGALKDTISQAEEKILMMYPWVRNIDVSVLKKFMDTESRMIIQEASLDDDTSVELIKLLLENNVQIRTMPHVHTVAVVADDKNGLIISTDPIYESYEVGVVYRDQKSIQEIEHMFEDAWNLSKEMNLEIKG